MPKMELPELMKDARRLFRQRVARLEGRVVIDDAVVPLADGTFWVFGAPTPEAIRRMVDRTY
jgi:hypothetical protein